MIEMNPRVVGVASLLLIALLPSAASSQAPAPDTLTPDGPATLRKTWLGAVPAIAYGPRVIVAWRIEVGPGGRGGPVALRVLRRNPNAPTTTGAGTSEIRDLPAAPGSYEFPSRVRILDGDWFGLDQREGGHMILYTHPPGDGDRWSDHSLLNAVDVWRPPLADGTSAQHGERLQGRQLLVTLRLERDVDSDGYGDLTQDLNDLATTATARRTARGVIVRAVVRNRGQRTVDQPRLRVKLRRGLRVRRVERSGGCIDRDPRGRVRCPWWESHQPGRAMTISLYPIAPGDVRTVKVEFSRSRSDRRWVRMWARSEGPDPTPADAAVAVRPRPA